MFIVVVVFIMISCFKDVTSQKDLTGTGKASQSSDYYHKINNWGHYHLATAATTGESHVWVDTYRYTCSATGPDQKIAWWMLSFPSMYFLTKVKIYYRDHSAYRLAGFSVYITNTTTIQNPPTGHLCYRHKGPELPELYQDIDCHYLGRNVVIYNNRTEGLDQYYKISSAALLELCGVKVFGCYKGVYGEHCNRTCRENCLGNHCYPENNTCVWGCSWKNCLHELCNKNYGTCTEGCLPGITGTFCKSDPSTTTSSSYATQTTTTTARSTQHPYTESGPNSKTDETDFNYNVLLIVLFAIIVIVVMAIILVCIIRRNHYLHGHGTDRTGSGVDNTAGNQQQNGRAQGVFSQDEYCSINFSTDNYNVDQNNSGRGTTDRSTAGGQLCVNRSNDSYLEPSQTGQIHEQNRHKQRQKKDQSQTDIKSCSVRW